MRSVSIYREDAFNLRIKKSPNHPSNEMPDFRISQAAVTDSDMVTLVDTCQNTTVGPNKYQLYCVTRSNLNGQCTSLPSTYTSAGSLNCLSVTSQPFLRSLYDSTGMACAINCYYPLSVDVPTLSIPPINLPTFSSPSYTFSSGRSTPTPTVGNGNGNGNGNNGDGLSDIGSNGGGNTGDNSGNGNGNNPFIGPIGAGNATNVSGGLTANDPNLLLTFMAVFAIMLFFVRKGI
ncbi:unnamed protein product [Mucor hiemalis]